MLVTKNQFILALYQYLKEPIQNNRPGLRNFIQLHCMFGSLLLQAKNMLGIFTQKKLENF